MLFTATAEPDNVPPRVRLDFDTNDSLSVFTALTVRRNGVLVRSQPTLYSSVTVLYDYDAEYGVDSDYTVDATIQGNAVDWTETWASVAAWTGSGWSVSAGAAVATVEGSTITRAGTGSLLSRIEFTNAAWVKIRILTSADVLVCEAWVLGDRIVLDGSGDAVTSLGSGAFTLGFSGTTVTLSGASYEMISTTFTGTPAKVRLVATLGTQALVTKWGSLGSGNSQFSGNNDVAVDPASGDVYVVDTGNNRVQKFTSAGVYVTKWGSYGTANGEFNAPRSAAVDSAGNVYVTDGGNQRVQKFTSSGTYVTKWGSLGATNGLFNNPRGIALDSSDNVFVVDTSNQRVQKFNSSGTYQSQFGSSGSGNGQFANPRGIDIDGSNNIYVADTFNNRVQKFNSAGTYTTQWGTAGTGDGQFINPWDIAVDSANNVNVVDNGNSRVQIFSNVGVFAAKFGTLGTADSQFTTPYGISVDSTNNIYVADTFNNRVQKFTAGVPSATVDNVTTYKDPAEFPDVASDSVILAVDAAWLLHSVDPSLSVLIDPGPGYDGPPDPIYATEITSQSQISPASGRTIHEIEGARLPIVYTSGPRRVADRILQLAAEDFAARDEILSALLSQDPMLLRSPSDWDVDFPEGWFSVGDVDYDREVGPLLEQTTVLSLPLTPIRQPTIEPTFGYTYADEVLAGGTYADEVAEGGIYLDDLTA